MLIHEALESEIATKIREFCRTAKCGVSSVRIFAISAEPSVVALYLESDESVWSFPFFGSVDEVRFVLDSMIEFETRRRGFKPGLYRPKPGV